MQCTPTLQKEILSYLRAGTFLRVAVEATGVPWSAFRGWLKQEGGAALRLAVMQGAAQARARAEIEVHQKSPLMWLKHGPGRERPGRPGWTNPVRPRPLPPHGRQTNFLHTPAGRALVQGLLEALERFPDARAAVVALLTGL